jgi:hypothetical protein
MPTTPVRKSCIGDPLKSAEVLLRILAALQALIAQVKCVSPAVRGGTPPSVGFPNQAT